MIEQSSSVFTGESILFNSPVNAEDIQEIILNENYIAGNFLYSPFAITTSASAGSSVAMGELDVGGFEVTSSTETLVYSTDIYIDPDFPSGTFIMDSFIFPFGQVNGRAVISGPSGTIGVPFTSSGAPAGLQRTDFNLKPAGLGTFASMEIYLRKNATIARLIHLSFSTLPVTGAFNE